MNDEKNRAVLFSVGVLVNKLRPRILTLEQTFGLLSPTNEAYFNVMVQEFTSLGYSVRWKVVELDGWGVPQTRKRLIMIGSCPGEKLPPMPPRTHGRGPGLLPPMTARRALAPIEEADRRGRPPTLHEPWRARRVNKPAWSPDKLINTLTAGGGGLYHYDGTREFTLREIASLQCFPLRHKFLGNKTTVIKQIGNAFPPAAVRVLYDHIRKWLLAQDGITPAAVHGDFVTLRDETLASPEVKVIIPNSNSAS
jgi:DNA (cytosine-5)-methyltransferase 1